MSNTRLPFSWILVIISVLLKKCTCNADHCRTEIVLFSPTIAILEHAERAVRATIRDELSHPERTPQEISINERRIRELSLFQRNNEERNRSQIRRNLPQDKHRTIDQDSETQIGFREFRSHKLSFLACIPNNWTENKPFTSSLKATHSLHSKNKEA